MIASWFLHGSLAHLVGNMVFLYIFGRILERRFGYKMLLIYFGAAIISDFFASLFLQGGIGASGAISGLVAAAILTDPFYITFLVFGVPIPILLLGLLSIFGDIAGVFSAEESNIGYFAHLGGYLSITLLIYFFSKEDRKRMKKGLMVNIAVVVFMALLYFLFK
jgi:membrane associated rhomboid family serine protease